MFGRRTTDDSAPVAHPLPSSKPAGKGRPTPKRREAERQRHAPVTAPKSRREAYRQTRQRNARQRAETRAAMARGDQRVLPVRDQGPVRAFVRDYVDSRRNVASLFMPLAFVSVILGSMHSTVLLNLSGATTFGLALLIFVDTLALRRQLQREVRQRFPDESLRGLTYYAFSRALMPRRFRFPKAKAGPGTKP